MYSALVKAGLSTSTVRGAKDSDCFWIAALDGDIARAFSFWILGVTDRELFPDIPSEETFLSPAATTLSPTRLDISESSSSRLLV